ncbi:MAG TPA: aldehyde dehydrogenase family protein [Planctomycetota bacterium]|nr:aldehyde dehydrogenase family protein [Planctomycetota bacterium]
MSEALRSLSPWDARDVVFTGAEADTTEVAAGATAMAAAFPDWSRAADRGERLAGLRARVVARRADIVALLVREAGKCRADAEAEADLLPTKIDITLAQGLARAPAAAPASSGALIAWRPRGVAAVLGPFNFPLHLLHGLVVPALAVGCTVVAKPSERTPALGALYRELIAAAGLADVCRVVLGGRATAAALVARREIATVAAVGGRAMGVALARALADRPEVVLALELGGVNQALVLDDADEGAAAAAIAEGAWRMAGQRCTATRIVHVPRARRDALIALIAERRSAWAPAADPAGAVGPMIGVAERERFQRAYRELPPGLTLVAGAVRSDDARADPLLLRVDEPRAREAALYREEQFGPALIVDAYDRLDECLARMAANPYRLAASVFTRERDRFLACAALLPYGQVNHDRPTAGARSDLPFGGTGHSGNGRPAAVAACQIFADECVVWPAR